ncbi:MAG TPA: hypothetical protein VJ870_04800 [Amycolatopsis sp.]|nr:hypothetical protein [Amycolatopsis sp.]
MTVRAFIAVVSALFVALFLILFSVPVHATTTGGSSVACGNGWKQDTSKAAQASRVSDLTDAMAADRGLYYGSTNTVRDYASACDSARTTRQIFGFFALGIGLIGLLGAAVTRRKPTPPAPPFYPQQWQPPRTGW